MNQPERPGAWGLVATIKAGLRDIQAFAAHHIDLGAHRLYLYLDDPDPDTHAALKAHPKIRVTSCDAAHWKKLTGKRPAKHQARQTLNATHAYRRRAEMDWLAHVDVDEFLWPARTVAEHLAALPADARTARVRPAEALAADPGHPTPGTCFKSTPVERAERAAATARLYPDFAAHIDDGFLSHVAGKIFVRTGLAPLEFRIHNAFQGDTMNPGQYEMTGIRLLHLHAPTWQDFRARFDYRHTRGAYRADLGRTGPSGLTLHEFFAALIDSEGESGLKRYYDRVCLAASSHCAALEREGLLHVHDLDLDAKIRKHFGSSG